MQNDILCTMRVRLGRLRLSDGMLLADARYGLAEFNATGSGTAKVSWHLRSAHSGSPVSSAPEDEWLVSPGEAVFSMLDNCPSGVAYALKFTDTKVCEFFWLQESSTEEFGESFVDAVNRILSGASGHQDEQPNAPRRSLRISETQLGGAPSGSLAKQRRARRVKFGDLLNVEALQSVTAGPDIVDRIGEHLPAGRPKTLSELLETIRCPQFQQTLGFLDELVAEGDLVAMAEELGVDPGALGPGSDANDLFEAFRAHTKRRL